MATKREIMALGTAAPLARALGSDSKREVTPGGVDQASATRLKTNFVTLVGATEDGQGILLPPAMGQYLHTLLNATGYMALIYPYHDETINNLLPAQPATLEGGELMVAIPARNAWMAGTMAASATQLGAGSVVDGPFYVGQPLLSPDPATDTLIADQLVARSTPFAGGPTDLVSKVGLNHYGDSTNFYRYTGNGAGAVLSTHETPAARFSIALAANNTAGMGALSQPPAGPTALYGGFHLVNASPVGANCAPFVVIGSPVEIPPAPNFPLRGALQANYLTVKAIPWGTAPTESVAVLGMNWYTDTNWTGRYADNGCAAIIDTHTLGSTVGRLSFSVLDVNAAGPGALNPQAGAGAMQIVYGQPGQPPAPFVMIGGGYSVPTAPPFPRNGTLIASQVSVRADALIPANPPGQDGGDRVSRIGLNAFIDNQGSAAIWRCNQPGPSAAITVHETVPGSAAVGPANMRFAIAEPGNAGDTVSAPTSVAIYGSVGTANGQTSISMMVNAVGTPILERVVVGAADSGGAGYRMLRVAN